MHRKDRQNVSNVKPFALDFSEFDSDFLTCFIFQELETSSFGTKMKNICKVVLDVDKRINFTMITDPLGNIQCMESRGKYMMPKKLVEQIGGAWSAVLGGIFAQLAQYHGPFEYTIVRHQKATTVGLGTETKYAIFTVEKDVSEELIEKVRKILTAE